MRPSSARLAPVLTLVLLASMASEVGLAGNDRDFSGSYDTSNAAEIGDEVAVTLQIEIFSHSNTDVFDATLILGSLSMNEEGADPVWVGVIGSLQSITVSAELTVDGWVYEQWQNGVPPVAWIEFADAAGQSGHSFLELVPSSQTEEVA